MNDRALFQFKPMYKIIKLDYARNSFRYLIKELGIKEVRIPYYLCDVMRHAAFAENCKPLFYHIDDNFMPAEEFNKDDYILYPNYFGVFDENVKKLADTYPRLIVDNAHAAYSMPEGLACFNSIRKFIPDKMESYLYIKTSEILHKTPDENKTIDKERINRFRVFDNKYRSINLLKFNLDKIKSPFCYPCLTATDDEADRLAEILEKEGKTIYRYWGELPKTFNEYKFYRCLVPIPLCY